MMQNLREGKKEKDKTHNYLLKISAFLSQYLMEQVKDMEDLKDPINELNLTFLRTLHQTQQNT